MELLRTRVDLDAIAHNTRLIKDKVAPAALMAVVKADGYGHGAVAVARIMAAHGADAFGVATLSEAIELRESGIEAPILAWIWSPEQEVAEALALGIELGVPSLAHARALVDAEVPARVSVKIDTGLHRSGVDPADLHEVLVLLRDTAHLTVTGLFSHLSCADEPTNPETDRQAERFRQAIDRARELGLDLPVNHLCNSPGALTRPDLHFDQVRVGLALYGLEPIAGLDHGLRPAMTWSGTITVVKPIAPGEGTSYGLTWQAAESGWLAVVPCGYADGLPRSFQGHLRVGVGGKWYPQVGRVCMDQIVIDLGDNPYDVRPGDEAVIFGEGGMSATELADAVGTINYEIICLPAGRTRRSLEGGIDL